MTIGIFFLSVALLVYLYLQYLRWQNKHLLSELLHTSQASVWIFDVQESLFTWLDAEGQPARQSTYEGLAKQLGEINKEKLYKTLSRLIAGKSEKETVYVALEMPGGKPPRNVQVNISVLERYQEKVTQIIGIAHDVTKIQMPPERSKIQEEKDISQYIRNIDYVLKAGGARIARYEPERHLLSIYSGMDQVKRSMHRDVCLRLMDADQKEQASSMLKQMDAGKACIFEVSITTRLKTAEGHPISLDLNLFPTYDQETGRLSGYFGLCRDTTRFRAAEARVLKERQLAQEAEKTQDDFLTNMSHDLLTPLNAIIASADRLSAGQTAEAEQRLAADIKQNSKVLLDLVNEAFYPLIEHEDQQ